MSELKLKALWLLIPAVLIAAIYFSICLSIHKHRLAPHKIAHSLFVGIAGGGCITALLGLFNSVRQIFWKSCCENLPIEFSISPPILCLGLALLAGHKVFKEFYELNEERVMEGSRVGSTENVST
jgi:hypothetical protein